ncbi:hypothetical protein OSCI_3590053 [Kamptonema sp. PCC 6506]|nr:hypothetical protein OSCI_3590053 [Kamptonema sp. PCC 6506]
MRSRQAIFGKNALILNRVSYPLYLSAIEIATTQTKSAYADYKKKG